MRYFLSIVVLLTLVFSATTEAAILKLQYDQVGNFTSGYGKYYEYNDSNQLVKVRENSSSGTVIAEYFYDYQGQRVKKIENGITTYYIGKHYEERKGDVVNEVTNYYFANNQKIAKKTKKNDKPAKVFYYLNNHLGSADVITDESGNEVDRLKYYPYGEYRTEGKERYSFTGKERDEVTDNYYFEARYYNPTIRRFTQADTVTPDLYDPQSLNRYAYTRNSPLVYTDPSGHVWVQVAYGLFEIGCTAYDAVATIKDQFNDQLSEQEKEESLVLSYAGIFVPGSGRMYKNSPSKIIGAKEKAKTLFNQIRYANRIIKQSPGAIGKYGETFVTVAEIIGPKARIFINNRTRIPDGLTNKVLSEVKNVKYLSYTRQLRDFADFVKEPNTIKAFDLYVRSNTKLSRPLREAIKNGIINLKNIPGL